MPNVVIEENILKSFFNDANCYIYWLDQNNIYRGCNSQFVELTGFDSQNDIIGKTNVELWSNVDNSAIKKIDNNNNEVLKSKNSKIFEEGIRTRQNQELSLLTQKTVIKNSDGKISGLLCISFNISELKKKEEYLTNIKELTELTLHQILSYLPTHVYWKDVNGVYLGCNDKQAKSLGKESGISVIGKTDFELPWGKDFVETYRKNDIEVMETKKVKMIEEKAIIDGNERIFYSQKAPLLNKNNDAIGIVGISVDITDLKNTQDKLAAEIKKVQRADCEKTSIVTVASHEIKGPLTNVLDILSRTKRFLENFEDNNSAKELLDLVNDNIEDVKKGKNALDNLVRFINLNISNYQKISGISIRDFLNKYCDHAANIKFKIKVTPNLPDIIKVSPFYLKEVCDIVIGNAIKFSKVNGNINITATLIEKLESKSFLELIVEDFGKGIDDNALKKFFMPLLPATNNISESRYITPAIKLSFVKKLTEDLGGVFEIHSVLTYGTKVKLLIPVELNDAQNANSMNEHHKSRYDFLKVLVVEENLLTLKLIKSNLNKFLNHIDTAASGTQAIALANKNKYDVVFLDISLPDIDGVELKNRITNILGENVFFIAVTSHNSEKDKEYFINVAGFTEVFEKPVEENDLKNCVNAIISAVLDTA
jgi:PAS domain S-box-containing protein